MSSEKYLLDADAFIRSKREHYAFDIVPGYWEAILKAHELRRVASIIPVRKELRRGNDDLAQWVKDNTPEAFFKKIEDQAVQHEFRAINAWVMANTQYEIAAKQRFVGGADPWLVAYAKANHYIVAMYEVHKPDSKASIKLPDIASEFGVLCIPPFEMLRRIQAKLKLVSGSIRR